MAGKKKKKDERWLLEKRLGKNNKLFFQLWFAPPSDLVMCQEDASVLMTFIANEGGRFQGFNQTSPLLFVLERTQNYETQA